MQPVRLGVAIAPPRVARRLRRSVGLPQRDGLLVRSVADGSAAAAAGIERGDLIVAAAGRPLAGVDALYAALDSLAPGDKLDLQVVRGTEERDVAVTFDREPEEATHMTVTQRRPTSSPSKSWRRSTPTRAPSRAWPSGSRPRSRTCASRGSRAAGGCRWAPAAESC